ncbi:MAG TPA: trehalose-6-phosphate synthase [Trebonia sp.]|jgi:trehalose 6-phosphate synthase|nr:trehalose-6-phosphate synthase [Trebonia sp.]
MNDPYARHPVIVASNRGPVSFSFADDGSLTRRRGGGGMVSGLSSALAANGHGGAGTLWICAAMSDADRAAALLGVMGGGGGAGGVDGTPALMLDIPPATFEAAYNGIANSVLWFVQHMLYDTPTQPSFGAQFRADWAAYAGYNEAFADALAEHAVEGSRVLIQDYHLSLAPRLLRARRPGARIGHFSHTPWAPPAYFQMLPDDIAAAILDGMLGADHLGFLADRWADAFLDCCESVLGAPTSRARSDESSGSRGLVTYRGRTTVVAAHPLGVDARSLRDRASQEDVRASMAGLLTVAGRQPAGGQQAGGQPTGSQPAGGQQAGGQLPGGQLAGGLQDGGRQLIVRVDRTELSKNIIRGLAAYRELLRTRPEWHGRVSHLAFAYPSRPAVAEYRAYTEQVIRTAEEINGEFGTPDWRPVLLEVKDDYARSLAACRVADVLLINPIRDGMNLVAEEGPILSDRGCALVLSREAGAASLIGDFALLVNPYDVSATAQALHEGLCMPLDERRRRCAAITAAASAAAPAQWLAGQLAGLSS